jgi:REP element-mobilizing transposase RayT
VPRPLRIEYAGACYHLVSRGGGRETIFADRQDREQFLQTLGEACGKADWQVHAYCLTSNHFHLVVETPQANLVAGVR